MSNTAPPAGQPREQWSGQFGFLVAAIGSAVGLGNIWRFPGVAYTNGGGAFLIPYLVALLAAGIPILIMEYGIGHRYRGSAPLSWRRLRRSAEPLGWFQVLVALAISSYYGVIIGWAAQYAVFSVNLAWGNDPATFFFKDFLQAAGEGVSLQFVTPVLVALLAVWVLVIAILAAGVRKGLQWCNYICLPLLFGAFTALVVRALFLPGAANGLNAFFTPDFAALARPAVWIAAFGQIFFSLSIAFGIMVTYSSYLQRDANLIGTGLTAGFANSAFEILAGIGVFAVLGFMAVQSNTEIKDLALTGVGLSFVAFPQIISLMPGGAVVGVLFFVSLVLAGLTSLISVVQVVSAAVQDRFGISPALAALLVGLPSTAVSCLLFATTTGLATLDTVDKFTNEFGIVGAAIVALIIIGHRAKLLPTLAAHLNRYGSPKVGTAWELALKWPVPAVLLVMLISAMWGVIINGYGGYATWFVAIFGWGTLLTMLALAFAITRLLNRGADGEAGLDRGGDDEAGYFDVGGAAAPHQAPRPRNDLRTKL